MTGDVRELLPLYALGVLEADEAVVVERALARDARLAAELAAYQQTADALGSIIEVTPPPEIKTRLMASVGGGRFEAFVAQVGKLFDVGVDRARELLGLIERPASWIPQLPGISLVHFEGGPAAAAADCGFIRVAAGGLFPPHTHLGEEVKTILSGRILDVTNNVELGPGDHYVQAEGTTHYLKCIGDEDCIYAARVLNGLEIYGTRVRPIT